MTNCQAIIETLIAGCETGRFVLQTQRGDNSSHTFWRTRPDEVALKDPKLEIALIPPATLDNLPYKLLLPGALPSLWSGKILSVQSLHDYFNGQHVVEIPQKGWIDTAHIPTAPTAVIDAAINLAVQNGQLWLLAGSASLLAETVPAGIITPQAVLQLPPPPVQPRELLPDNLPAAWSNGQTTAKALSEALAPLPWSTVKRAIDIAVNQTRQLDRTADSLAWPCEYSNANGFKLALPKKEVTPLVSPVPQREVGSSTGYVTTKSNTVTAEISFTESHYIQDLNDHLTTITRIAKGLNLTFNLKITLSGSTRPSDEVITQINERLKEIDENFQLR